MRLTPPTKVSFNAALTFLFFGGLAVWGQNIPIAAGCFLVSTLTMIAAAIFTKT